MSYDITIDCETGKPRTDLEAIIARQPSIHNQRFTISDTHYMEIDLEPDEAAPEMIAYIAFHIPYAFLDKVGVDFDAYFDCINALACDLNARAYDCQLDVFLHDERFARCKPALIQTAVQLSRLIYADNRLYVHCAYANQEFIWDLARGTYAGTRQTPTRISNYDCYTRETRSGDLTARADPQQKAILITDASNPDDVRMMKRTGETVLLKFVDRQRLLSASQNRAIKLWDTVSLKCLKTFKGHLDAISDVIAINEKLLISSSIGGSLIFWDVATAKAVLTILHSHVNAAWIAVDAAGNFAHSDHYKGVIRWDFGKQQFTPHTGLAIDTVGGWNYQAVPNTQGTDTPELVAAVLARYHIDCSHAPRENTK